MVTAGFKTKLVGRFRLADFLLHCSSQSLLLCIAPCAGGLEPVPPLCPVFPFPRAYDTGHQSMLVAVPLQLMLAWLRLLPFLVHLFLYIGPLCKDIGSGASCLSCIVARACGPP